MPLFEFRCRACGRTFEEILTLAELEAEPPACPACGAPDARREFSTFATGSGGGSTGCGPSSSGFS